MSLNQNDTPLFTALKKYKSKNVIPFDVPGHKHGRGVPELMDFLGSDVLEVDVNSMKPLDNIENPTGVIKKAEKLMADAFNSDAAFFLVNGTTFGVQAMIMSICSPGDKIILPRNVHESAIKALILSGAIPVYIQPEVDKRLGIALGITPESIERAIKKNPDAKAVFVIHPTYYGMVSDLHKIISVARKHNMAVLVDEAHGTHFYFHYELPSGAMKLGADMSAVSIHKTGGSLTQSSALLLNEKKVTRDHMKTILNLTQTTSASYLLMASLDVARKKLATEGYKLMEQVLELSRYARDKINEIHGLYAFGPDLKGQEGIFDFDETKLGIRVSDLGMTGFQVYDILRDKYNIQVEFGDVHNILAVITLGDIKENIDILINALRDISSKYTSKASVYTQIRLTNPDIIISPRDAFYSSKRAVPLKDAEGEISGESIMAYPPGIPIISPGERITREIIEYIQFLKKEKSIITGAEDENVDMINVLGN